MQTVAVSGAPTAKLGGGFRLSVSICAKNPQGVLRHPSKALSRDYVGLLHNHFRKILLTRKFLGSLKEKGK